jgi:hypothetical protein
MREYNVIGGGITLANQPVTLVFIHPGTSAAIKILRAWISQTNSATAAMQRVQFVRQVTAFPTLTSATPQKIKEGDPASGITGGTAGAAGTCGINASAEGAGAKTVIMEDAFNTINGFLWVPTPDEQIICSPGSASGFGLFLPVAAASLSNWSFGVTFAELG